ncbi:hypothetical protein [Elizabethkingia anophelis]|uniref:hypothetical protein n=1 Tax=Elizabethkingia anophelis TaxID=1117645 RepID=UPI0024E23274|nr:hypothetical protein [Elizabethkingia anophelis]CAH1150059.1 hypothetical protein EAVVTKC53_03118 [Elizabethkingia anophelis]CAI9678631.1 hypothetical protein EAVVTKC53_00725 [Elizabethkingia anophelis]
MANIINYLKTSQECSNPLEQVETANFLKANYFKLDENERKSLLNFLIISNFCHAFKVKPLIYEQLTQYISDKFKINKNQIILLGSARTGFAIDFDNYGREFSEKSDLDFAIIDENTFNNCVNDFKLWKRKTDDNEYDESVKNRYWSDNQRNLKTQIKKGFIDTYKIPNFIEFSTTQQINNSLALIVINLKNLHGIVVKGASVRVYNDWETFQKQLRINIESILKKIS